MALICTQEVISAIKAGGRPQFLLRIIHRGGQYLMSDKALPETAKSALGRPRFDGTRKFDGTWSFGGEPAVLFSGRVIKKYGKLKKSLTSSSSGLKSGLKQSDPDTLQLDILPSTPVGPGLRGARADLLAVWPGLAVRDGLVLFRGEVSQVRRSRKTTRLKLTGVGVGIEDSLKEPIALKKASIYPSPRNASDLLPAVWGDLSVGGHGGQYRAVCLSTTSFVYGLAGHPIQALADGGEVHLFDRYDQSINPADYTLNTSHDYLGRGLIATATFAVDVSAKEPIGVACRGKADAAGDLITNPVAIARDLTLNHAGRAQQDLHPASWVHAEALSTAQGYEAARALTSQHRAGDLLWGLLYSNFAINWWIDGDGLIRLLPDGGAGYIPTSSIVGHIDAKLMADAEGDARTQDICNQLSVSYAPKELGQVEWQGFDDGEGARDQLSQQRAGRRVWDVELAWIRSLAVANERQEVHVGRHASTGELFTLGLSDARLIRLQRGDHLTISAGAWLPDEDGLPLSHQICRVEHITIDPHTGRMELGIRDTGGFRTMQRRFDGTWSFNGQGKFGGERYKREAA